MKRIIIVALFASLWNVVFAQKDVTTFFRNTG